MRRQNLDSGLLSASLLLAAHLVACSSTDTERVDPQPGAATDNGQTYMELDTLWDFSDAAVSESRFRAFAEEHAEEGALRAEALTQLARAQGKQGRFDEGDATLDEAEQLLDDGPSRARTRLLLERGRLRNSSGDRAAARPLFEKALQVGESAGEVALALDAVHMLGIASEPADALRWNVRGVELANASDDPAVRRWLGPLHHNTGMIHLEAKAYPEARAAFEAGRAFRDSVGDVPGERIGRWTVAHTLRLEGRAEEALEVQLELEAEIEGDPDAAPDGFVHEELGECLLLLGRTDEARPHFARAHELLAAMGWFADSEPERLARLKELGAG